MARGILDRTQLAAVASGKRGKPSSGLRISMGEFQEEYLTDFKFATRSNTIDRMINDPAVYGHLMFFKTPLLEGEWRVEAATQDKRDQLIAAVVRANLYRKGPRSYWTATPWRQRLGEILDGMLQWGFALFYRERATMKGPLGTFQLPSRLVWLHPRTVEEWDIDGGDNLVGVWRSYEKPDGTYMNREYISSRDLVIYPLDIVGAGYEGRSKIRPMFRPWKLKDVAERVEAVDLQRRGTAVPYGRLSKKPTKNEKRDMEKAVKMLRGEAPDYAWLLLGEENEVGFIEPSAAVRDSLPIIERKTLDMAAAMNNMFTLLGTTQSGSRAVAEVQMDMSMLPVNSLAKWVAELELNGCAGQTGLIEEIVELNWSDVEELPKLIVERINPREHRSTIPDMIECLKEEGVLPKDMEVRLPLQQELLERLGFAVPDKLKTLVSNPGLLKDTADDPEKKPDPADNPFMNPNEKKKDKKAKPSDDDEEDVDEEAAAARARAPATLDRVRKWTLRALDRAGVKLPDRLTLAFIDETELKEDVDAIRKAKDGMKVIASPGGRGDHGFFRTPTPFEQRFVQLNVIQTELQAYEGLLFGVLKRGRKGIIAETVRRIRSGSINPKNAPYIREAETGPVIMHVRTIRSELRKAYVQVLRFGRQTVRDEINRQLKSQEIEAEFKMPIGLNAWQQTLRNAETTVNLAVGAMIDNYNGSFLSSYQALVEGGLPPSKIADLLEKDLDLYSDRPLSDASRALSSKAFNAGRNAGIQERLKNITRVVRSEVLDAATCSVCADLDGRVFTVNTPEYNENMPPKKCLGKGRCRGFYLVIAEGPETPPKAPTKPRPKPKPPRPTPSMQQFRSDVDNWKKTMSEGRTLGKNAKSIRTSVLRKSEKVLRERYPWLAKDGLVRWDKEVVRRWSASSTSAEATFSKWHLRKAWGENPKKFYWGQGRNLGLVEGGPAEHLKAAKRMFNRIAQTDFVDYKNFSDGISFEQFSSFMDDYVAIRQAAVETYYGVDTELQTVKQLYRGHNFSGDIADWLPAMAKNPKSMYSPNGISSWSESRSLANSFSHVGNSAVFAVEADTEAIWGSWHEGTGWYYGVKEKEVILSGSKKLNVTRPSLRISPDKVVKPGTVLDAPPPREPERFASWLKEYRPEIANDLKKLYKSGWRLEISQPSAYQPTFGEYL